MTVENSELFGAPAAHLQVSYDRLMRGLLPVLEVMSVPAFETAAKNGDVRAHALLLPVFQGNNGLELAGGSALPLSTDHELALWKLLVALGVTGKVGELTSVPASAIFGDEAPFEVIITAGLGEVDEVSAETIREVAGAAVRAVPRPTNHQADDADDAAAVSPVLVSALGLFDADAALVGHGLGAYAYAGEKQANLSVSKVIVLQAESVSNEDARATTDKARTIVEHVCLARDLVNAPGNVLFPESYAQVVAELATAAGCAVEVLDEEVLAQQGYGGIIGVGQGSARPPRLVRISYNADREDLPLVALVGKGITFDTGGISLKPGANMWDMIMDMGGSAAVVASILAAARLGIELRITATIPMAENMPGSNAIRPGDILRHYGGKTTEVLNTDAEGRLVLADAIVRACEDQPKYLIEAATLTGAQMVALGNRTPGIMGSIALRDQMSVISRDVGENAWPMPLPKELGEELKSDVADLRNISGSRWGGMSVAGHYLKAFVPEGVEWVHIDIAGPAYNTGAAYGYNPKRATGSPVRTIIGTLEHLAKQR